MFDEENLNKLKDLSARINFILELCEEEGIVKALEDIKQKQPAIIMHFIVCNENLQKIQDSFELNIMEIFSKEDIRGLRAIRNIASHDYDGLNLAIIEDIIRFKLPQIKSKLDKFLLNQKLNSKQKKG